MNDLNDWSLEWEQPDPRISYLKDKTHELSNSIGVLTTIGDKIPNVEDNLAKVKEELESISLQLKMLQLYAMCKIDNEQFKSLMKLVTSPDKENLIIAVETINNLMEDI